MANDLFNQLMGGPAPQPVPTGTGGGLKPTGINLAQSTMTYGPTQKKRPKKTRRSGRPRGGKGNARTVIDKAPATAKKSRKGMSLPKTGSLGQIPPGFDRLNQARSIDPYIGQNLSGERRRSFRSY